MSDIIRHNGPDGKAPWLVAAWPGMGSVAMISTLSLVQKLGAKPIAGLSSRGYFDVQQIEVTDGLIGTPRMPRSIFYRWSHPKGGRDLVFFLGESQPTKGLIEYSHSLLDSAAEMGVSRIVTFASMASQLHPSAEPRVRAVATKTAILEELKRVEVSPLDDGEIGGMNGVLLAAGAERGLEGMCLLGEIPFYAANVPSPKAAKAVLEVFAAITDVQLDLTDLEKHAETVEKALLDMLERRQPSEGEGEEVESEGDETAEDEPAAEVESKPTPTEKVIDFATRSRIEALFEETRKDRGKAVELKRELDQLGVFERYENRFLDLFKRAG